jgi:hypothetical protein
LNSKVWEFDPSGYHRFSSADSQVETPDWKSIGRWRQGQVNIYAAFSLSNLSI